MFSLLLIVGFAPGTARAAELADNLASATAGAEGATTTRWLAAAFTTDASTAYELTSVTLLLANTSPGTAALDLYSDAGLEPGTLVATLTSPASYASTPAAATFSAGGLPLDPNATYWLVLRALGGTFDWAWTTENTGSGVGFDPTWDVSEDAGAAWYTNAVYPLQLRVTVNGTDPITDCNQNGVPDDVDIANGTSSDCNANGVPDSCDIASGSAVDCNANSVPDSCDLASGSAVDCNSNGVPDSCDLASGSAVDCNTNGVPDSCDVESGSSLDCNLSGSPDECELGENDCDRNLVPDSCDIAAGTSLDCNLNATPDSCDLSSGSSLDCNADLIPDECNIASGSSADTNANGIPDECEPPELQFLRGDCNSDGEVGGMVTDAVFLLNFNFVGGPRPSCLSACDSDGDGQVTGVVTDAVYLLTYNFLGGPPPVAPFPACGPGEREGDEALGCETPPEACAGG